jgi:hypothetical protein
MTLLLFFFFFFFLMIFIHTLGMRERWTFSPPLLNCWCCLGFFLVSFWATNLAGSLWRTKPVLEYGQSQLSCSLDHFNMRTISIMGPVGLFFCLATNKVLLYYTISTTLHAPLHPTPQPSIFNFYYFGGLYHWAHCIEMVLLLLLLFKVFN